jgi:hypothetical protein
MAGNPENYDDDINKESQNMIIPTVDKLFDHNCQFKDMKLSAFNPKMLTYYCQICGGKFIIERDMQEWAGLFGEPINLRLSKKVLIAVLEERKAEDMKEEEELARKEEEARMRAEKARKKAEDERRSQDEERIRKLKEEKGYDEDIQDV